MFAAWLPGTPPQGFRHPHESIGDCNEDVIDSPSLQVVLGGRLRNPCSAHREGVCPVPCNRLAAPQGSVLRPNPVGFDFGAMEVWEGLLEQGLVEGVG